MDWIWFHKDLLIYVSSHFQFTEIVLAFGNKHRDRGNELEEFARSMYELETWSNVNEVWFIEHNEFIWCSPDWLIWEDWGVEIKCLMDTKHFWHIIWTEKLEKWHLAQIQMCLMITWRKWWDYVLYNPNYKKSLIIHRILPDVEFQAKLKKWLKTWTEKIKFLKEKYNLITK